MMRRGMGIVAVIAAGLTWGCAGTAPPEPPVPAPATSALAEVLAPAKPVSEVLVMDVHLPDGRTARVVQKAGAAFVLEVEGRLRARIAVEVDEGGTPNRLVVSDWSTGEERSVAGADAALGSVVTWRAPHTGAVVEIEVESIGWRTVGGLCGMGCDGVDVQGAVGIRMSCGECSIWPDEEGWP